ncbi:MAG TPA: hypothetical protein VMK13_02345 [Streptosporangiaceae bacterium]|nr:hypothetical protein [Streptosporangiaceae bacterium]
MLLDRRVPGCSVRLAQAPGHPAGAPVATVAELQRKDDARADDVLLFLYSCT